MWETLTTVAQLPVGWSLLRTAEWIPLCMRCVYITTFLTLNKKLRRMSFSPWFSISCACLQIRLVPNGFSSTLIGGWPPPLDSFHFSLCMLYKIVSKWKIYGISGDHLESGFTKLTTGSAWQGVQSSGEEQWPRASKLMFWFTMWLGTQNLSDENISFQVFIFKSLG